MAFLLTLFAFSLLNINLTLGGWETDPTGDAGGISACDITQVNVDVTYHSHPTDDDITLKITLAAEITINLSAVYSWYDYSFYVDTSLSDNPDTTALAGDDSIYEYRALLGRKYNNNTKVWSNTSSLYCTRYYYTGDGSGKTMGSFYWNPNTDTWQASDPLIDFGQVIGNTIVWDVTGAIYREQPIGTGYVVQGVATASYGLVVKDEALESGWVDEFDNCCPTPNTSTTPTTPSLPSIGFLFSIVFIGLVASSIAIIRKRK